MVADTTRWLLAAASQAIGLNAAPIAGFAAALLMLSGCAGYQVRDASRELGGLLAESLFHLAVGGPEALADLNESKKERQRMAYYNSLTPAQREAKRERRMERRRELDTWDRYDELTSIERRYGLIVDESGVPLRMPVESAQNTGPFTPMNPAPQ